LNVFPIVSVALPFGCIHSHLRYAAAFKQLQQGAILQAKVDAAKEEVDDASARMEQTRVSNDFKHS
jgi:hypothetical protein